MNRLIIDTETAGTFGKSLVYDFGGVIVDSNFNELYRFNYVVRDVFHGMPWKMRTAYYADKIPAYNEQLENGTITMLPLVEIRNILINAINEHNVREVWAFNAQFDRGALNYTISKRSNGFITDFFEGVNIEWHCIMGAALSTICHTMKFVNNANRTEKGNVSCGVQSVWRYLTNNENFIEAHTALADAEIEAQILGTCLKRKKKMDTTPKQLQSFRAYQEIRAMQ